MFCNILRGPSGGRDLCSAAAPDPFIHLKVLHTPANGLPQFLSFTLSSDINLKQGEPGVLVGERLEMSPNEHKVSNVSSSYSGPAVNIPRSYYYSFYALRELTFNTF